MNNQVEALKCVERMSSVQIAEITGKNHRDVLRSIRNMESAWEKVNGSKFALVEYTDAKGEKRPCYMLTKVECLYIATKYNDEARAKLILRWYELETGAKHMNVNVAAENSIKRIPTKRQVEAKMAAIEYTSRIMNLNDSSKAMMCNGVLEEVGVNQIEYVPSNGVLKPISVLLKEHGIEESAQSYNKKLLAAGYLEQETRRTKKGEKSFYCITEKGLQYGENQVSPNNPRETQPMWYSNKFQSLNNSL